MAVQTLTWLEMVEDEISLTDVEHIRDGPRNTEVDLSSLLDHFDRISHWRPSDEPHVYDGRLPEMRSNREDDTQREESIQTFTPRFFAALDKMPKLKELISQPMPIARELTTPSGQPPLQLCLVDESIWTYLRRLAGSFAKCLENLTHINLCISNIRNLEELDCAVASSLKDLTFHNCHVTIRTIHALSKIPELELKRCVSTTIQVKIDSLEEVILKWYESDNENYERLDEEYDGGGDVDIEEDEDSDEIPMMTQISWVEKITRKDRRLSE
ncbi:hypothetical protein TrVGV298_009494 [Trichoderma virens]|nr:hypothetical protein TrVGV298_009494 [Trichoderma virens]